MKIFTITLDRTGIFDESENLPLFWFFWQLREENISSNLYIKKYPSKSDRSFQRTKKWVLKNCPELLL